MRSMWSRRFVIGVVPIALSIGAASVAVAQGGTLTGTVTSQAGGTPLQEARVLVVGTSLFATTGPDGKYTVRRVPAGSAEVRLIRVGYQEQKKSVRIVDGQTATLDFVMSTSIVQLQEVDGYNKFRAQVIQQFGDTSDSRIAERMVKAALLMPANAEDMKKLSAMASVAGARARGRPAVATAPQPEDRARTIRGTPVTDP